MASDTQTINSELRFDASQPEKALDKLQKRIQASLELTEKNLYSLNKTDPIYQNLIKTHDKLSLQKARIAKATANENKNTVLLQQTVEKVTKNYTKLEQEVRDTDKYTKNITKSSLKNADALQKNVKQVDKLKDNFASLNREVRQLEGHYKEFGNSKNFKSLKEKLAQVRQEQEKIETLSKKGASNLNSSEISQATNRYRNLKNEVAELKTNLSDIPTSGLAFSMAKRAVFYSALFAGIASTTQAIRSGIEFVLEYDRGVQQLGTVLDLTGKQAKNLQEDLAGLTQIYGEQLGAINKVALELSRAGLAYDRIAEASEVVIKLALLTGDSIEQSASSIISFVQVFGKDQFGQVIATVDELGAKLAYLANKSRLGTQDINTFANYALAAAKASGLTIDAVNGLASAFSNAGQNSSTIGSQIRKFTIALSNDSKAIQDYFEKIGVNQEVLARRIAQGGEESNKALIGFLDTIKNYNRDSYNEALQGVEVLTRNVLQALQNNANEIQTNLRESLSVTSNELDKANQITESYSKTWIKAFQDVKVASKDYVDFMVDIFTEIPRIISKSKNFLDVYDLGDIFSDTASIDSLRTKLNELQLSSNKLNFDETEKEVKEGTKNIIKDLKAFNTYINRQIDIAKKDKDFDRLFDLEALQDNVTKATKNVKSKAKELVNSFRVQKATAELEGLKTSLEGLKETGTTEEIKKVNSLILKYETILGNGKTTTKEFIDTLEGFDSEEFQTVKDRLINLGRTIDVVNDKGQLKVLEGITTKELTRLEKEIPQVYSNIQKTLNSSGLEVDFLGDVSFEAITESMVLLQDKMYANSQRMKTASKEEKLELQNNNSLYQKSYDQLSLIVEAKNKIEQTQKKINEKEKSTNKSTNKSLRIQDENQKRLTESLLLQEQLDKKATDKIDKLRIEIQVREENLSKLKTEEAKEQEINKIKQKKIFLLNEEQKAQEKKDRFLEKTKQDLLSEQKRIDILLGKKKEELTLEKELRELKRSEQFQNLSEDEQTKIEKQYENLIKQEKAYSGLNKALTEYQKKIPTLNESLEMVANSGLQSLENGFMDFFDITSQGFMDMEKLGLSVISNIYKAILKTRVIQPLVNAIGGAIGGVGSTGGASWTTNNPSVASGAIAFNNGGYLPKKNFAEGGILQGGSGVRDDLYLGSASGSYVFAMGGEYFTKKSSVNSETRPTLDYINKTGKVPNNKESIVVNTPVKVEIENKTSEPIEAEMIQEMLQTNERGEEEKIIKVVIDRMQTDSGFRSIMKS